MRYLLVYLFVHYGGTIPFSTKESCEAAITRIAEQTRSLKQDMVCIEQE